jgi:hypothetical protein
MRVHAAPSRCAVVYDIMSCVVGSREKNQNSIDKLLPIEVKGRSTVAT